MRAKGYLCIGTVCLFYWILDSIWSYLSFEYNLKQLIFSEPSSPLETFLLKVPPYQVVSRLMVVTLFVVLGNIIIQFLIRRQAAEQQRQTTHDTLLTVLNSIDATIYVSDMKTNEILFMNQNMIDSFGGDFTGRICHEIFRHRSKVCDHCPNGRMLDESGNPMDVVMWEGWNPVTEAWYLNYDRAIQWIDGNIVHLQIATDITQFKALQEKQSMAEAKLRQSQKMESIGNLAGGIAHDFNNILASIIGYTELALDDIEKGSSVWDDLQEIYSASTRAKDLITQILAFARRSEEVLGPVQVGTTATEVLKLIRSSIPSSIDITQTIESDSFILGNATQVHQILMNLCTNAAHAMEDEGGMLAVRIRDIVIGHEKNGDNTPIPPGDYVELQIQDSGKGIPPDIIDTIFEPYFTTKGIGKGSGMGLAMVHGIVESYGGKISVKSTMGKGTTFTVYLPITKKQRPYPPCDAETLPSGTERILLVDDEAKIVKMGAMVLSRLGYDVTTRTCPLDALALFRSKPEGFDLIISDMTMPNMTGDRLALEIMRIRPDMRVMIWTGYSRRISEEVSADIGIKAFAYKPIIKAELAKTVRRVLDDAEMEKR